MSQTKHVAITNANSLFESKTIETTNSSTIIKFETTSCIQQQPLIHPTSNRSFRRRAKKKKIDINKISSNIEANSFFSNGCQIKRKDMKIILDQTDLCDIGCGLSDIHKIGDFLFVVGHRRYTKIKPVTMNGFKQWLKGYRGKEEKWEHELKKYKTIKDALHDIQNNLNTTQFEGVLTAFINAIKDRAENGKCEDMKTEEEIKKAKEKNQRKKERKKLKKQRKKERKQERNRKRKLEENINNKFKMNICDKDRNKILQEMDGFIDYGLLQKPPKKKQKLCNDDKISMVEIEGMNEMEYCANCKKQLMCTDRFRCSKCKNVWYCGKECQLNHWNVHEIDCILIGLERTYKNGDGVNIKIEKKSVKEWNWYDIICWLNRVKNGRFNGIKYMDLRKHIFIGKLKGYQLSKINHITLNMIGIYDYNDHQMILNMIAELIMNDNWDNNMDDMMNIDVIPETYIDPICYEVMSDPVIVTKSGNVYERKYIEQYVKEYNKDPLTLQEVELKDIVTLASLKCDIDNWKDVNLR